MSTQQKLQKLHRIHASLLKLQHEVHEVKESAERTKIMQQILKLQREYDDTLAEARSDQAGSLR